MSSDSICGRRHAVAGGATSGWLFYGVQNPIDAGDVQVSTHRRRIVGSAKSILIAYCGNPPGADPFRAQVIQRVHLTIKGSRVHHAFRNGDGSPTLR